MHTQRTLTCTQRAAGACILVHASTHTCPYAASHTGTPHLQVERLVFDATYLVLGLGDVYLGAPCAVPMDPRHRLVTTKMNPARTFTHEGTVGIGGCYMCIYPMDSPGASLQQRAPQPLYTPDTSQDCKLRSVRISTWTHGDTYLCIRYHVAPAHATIQVRQLHGTTPSADFLHYPIAHLPHPGGYQLVGRTLPIWNTFGRSGPFSPTKPWLLQFFDQVKFYLVSEEELERMRAGFATGQFDIDIRESTFDVAAYTAMVKSVEAETATFKVG